MIVLQILFYAGLLVLFIDGCGLTFASLFDWFDYKSDKYFCLILGLLGIIVSLVQAVEGL